jgi:hypothetical protein
MEERISDARFRELTRSLVGLPVSRTWRGGGTAIFFELGALTAVERQRKDGSTRTSYFGEVGIMLQWSWRVERPRSVLFGSWSKTRVISNQLKKLQGTTVLDVSVEGRLPELVLQISGGHWVHSFTTVDGQPQWCLFLDRTKDARQWITSDLGKICLSSDDAAP